MIRTKGFTLIELLVVIAIIGILAAVILANLGAARDKGKDAAVQGDLDSLRSQAEIYSSNNNGAYDNLFTGSWTSSDPTIQGILDSVTTDDVGGVTFGNDTSTTWAAVAQLPSTVGSTTALFWCVDNNGTSKLWAGATPPDSSVAACE